MDRIDQIAKAIVASASVKAAPKTVMTQEIADQLRRKVESLKKKLRFDGTDGIGIIEWDLGINYFTNPPLIYARALLTGKVITKASDLKKYANIFIKADQAYQNGKKEINDFVKKNNLEVEFSE